MSALPISRRSERATIVLIAFLVGLALGLFQSMVWLVSEPLTSGVTSSPSLAAFLLLVAPLVWAIAFFSQGIWVGYRTSYWSQGALTGFFSGIFGGLTAAVGHVLIITLSLHDSSQDPIATAYATMGVATLTMVLTVGAGSVFGALGAFVGQYFSPVPPVPPNLPFSGAPQPPVSPSSIAQPPPSQKLQTGGGSTAGTMKVATRNSSEIVL